MALEEGTSEPIMRGIKGKSIPGIRTRGGHSPRARVCPGDRAVRSGAWGAREGNPSEPSLEAKGKLVL